MKAAYDAIFSLFNALPENTFHAALGGRMYLNRAPQSVTFPYCVVSPVVNLRDLRMNYDDQLLTLQFAIYYRGTDYSTQGVQTVEDCRSKLWALYSDFCPLSVSGYTSVIMKRERDESLLDAEMNTYYSITRYELRISKN